MVLCGPPRLAFSVRQGCQQLLGRALAKLRAHSPHSYRTQAKYSIYGSFMILSPWCYLFYDWLRDLYLQPHYGPWFVQQKTLLPALPWEGFQRCDGETPTTCQALCGHRVQEAGLCLSWAGSILKISTRNARHKEKRWCPWHIQSASPRFSHMRLKGHSLLQKAVTN